MKSMKNLFRVGLIALAVVITLAGCPTDADTDDGNSQETYTGKVGDTTYTLVITNGTDYTLTVGDKESTGTAAKEGDTFTLTPSKGNESFTLTVNAAGGITGGSGTITFDDESTQEAPEQTTPVAPPSDGNSQPKPKGVNALSGKTYFEYQSKTVFSATAEDASSGTYSVFEIKRDDRDRDVLDNDGKYTYDTTEIGTYSWDEAAKTVTLVPEKAALSQGGKYGDLQTKEEYKAAAQAMMDEDKEMDEEAFNEQFEETGFSSVSAYLEYMVNETFAQKTDTYSFSDDAKALFLEEVLPDNKGANELAGQTYNGMTWDNDDQRVKDTNQVYTFTAGGTYLFADNSSDEYKEPSQEGKYAVDSSNAQRKRVYLQPVKIGGKTRAQYYVEQIADSEHNYADDDALRAAQTNSDFSVREQPYNHANKTIGWED
jgi:hypothetical protein